jgi:hypothetical protein
MYYVLWDKENEIVTQGPQTFKPSDAWVPYFHGKKESALDVLVDYWDDDRQAVVQRCKKNTSWFLSRVEAYPSVNKQLAALYDDIQNNTLDQTGAFFNMIKEVKENIPK